MGRYAIKTTSMTPLVLAKDKATVLTGTHCFREMVIKGIPADEYTGSDTHCSYICFPRGDRYLCVNLDVNNHTAVHFDSCVFQGVGLWVGENATVTLVNCRFEGPPAAAIYAGLEDDTPLPSVVDMRGGAIVGGSTAVVSSGTSAVSLRGVDIRSCRDNAVSSCGFSSRITLHGVDIRDCGGENRTAAIYAENGGSVVVESTTVDESNAFGSLQCCFPSARIEVRTGVACTTFPPMMPASAPTCGASAPTERPSRGGG